MFYSTEDFEPEFVFHVYDMFDRSVAHFTYKYLDHFNNTSRKAQTVQNQ
jgi:hypothetical protein